MKEYLTGIIAAAMICAIVVRFAGNKGTGGVLIKLIAGLFLAFTIIVPIAGVDLRDLVDFTVDFSEEGKLAALEGQEASRETIAAGIKTASEAYILDKAAALDAVLKVEVTLSKEDIPHPESVHLSGNVSPFAKSTLQDLISRELGIDKENQIWT